MDKAYRKVSVKRKLKETQSVLSLLGRCQAALEDVSAELVDHGLVVLLA
jgi:hypothetical protein